MKALKNLLNTLAALLKAVEYEDTDENEKEEAIMKMLLG